jgi:hypothetical protein
MIWKNEDTGRRLVLMLCFCFARCLRHKARHIHVEKLGDENGFRLDRGVLNCGKETL